MTDYEITRLHKRARIEAGLPTAGAGEAQGSIFAGNPDSVVRQINDFQSRVGGCANLVFTSGFMTHEQAAKGLKLPARDVLPQLEVLGTVTNPPVQNVRPGSDVSCPMRTLRPFRRSQTSKRLSQYSCH